MEIIIQKFCYCCDLQHLNLFEKYLSNKKLSLPSNLIKSIIANPKQTINFYCTSIYGDTDAKTIKSFNQLSYYTLRLFSFVIQNFPTFLSHNISKIEWFVFNNEIEKAVELYAITKEVALKVENYPVLIQLNHLSNKLSFSLTKALAISDTEKEVFIRHQNDFENILLKQNVLIKKIRFNNFIPKDEELAYFISLFNSKSKSVNIFAKQSYLNILSTSNNSSFYNDENLSLIKSTIKQIDNNSFLMIMQHKEQVMKLDYMLLKHTRNTFDDKIVDQYNSKIISKWSNFYSDSSKFELAMLFSLSIKASYYATKYYFNNIPEKKQLEIKEILLMCDNIRLNVNWDIEGYLKYISFCIFDAIYLLLDNQEEKAIKLIEKVLHEFQQKKFKKLIDQLFVVLIMAYFQSKNYDKTIDTYQRYKKHANNLTPIEENDLILQAIYYLAQIKMNNRKQYHAKLSDVINTLKSNIKLKGDLGLVKRAKKVSNII
jgi:hypothetical protein